MKTEIFKILCAPSFKASSLAILFSFSLMNGAYAQSSIKKSAQSIAKVKESQLRGQVFIVTKEGMTIKLALINVGIYKEADLLRQISDIESRDREERKKILATADAATAAFNEIDPKYKSARNQAEFAIKLSSQQPMGVPGSADRAMHESGNRIVQEKIDALKAITPEWQEKRSAMLTAVQAAREIANPAHYIQGLGKAVASSKSDADGNFEMKVPVGVYVLTAMAKRMVGDDEEEYAWLVRVDATSSSPKVMLSNDSLYATKCSDCIPLPNLQ